MKCDCELCQDATSRMIMHCGIGACHFPLGAVIEKKASNSVSTVRVTRAQVNAAKLIVKRAYKRGEYPSDAIFAIANATMTAPEPEKASNSVSKPPVLKCECPFDDGTHEYTTHCGCDKCEYPNGAPIKPRKEVSTNMIHARELDINGATTVTELFELIDLPYRTTKRAQVSIVPWSNKASLTTTFKLRLEWTGGDE